MVEDNDVLGFKSGDYRWIVIKVKDNIIEGGVFIDKKDIGKRIGVSYSTLKRRLKEMNGLGRIKINGYTIQEMPYFKSKRGPNNDNE